MASELRDGHPGLRRGLLVAGALTAAAWSAPAASAGTFDVTYDQTGGIAGLGQRDSAPLYTVTRTTGDGFRVRPTGNGGTIYPSDGAGPFGEWTWDAPAGSTIKKAVVSGVDGKAQDGQRTRLELLHLPGQNMPDYDTDLVTNKRNWGQQLFTDGQTWAGKTFTLTPTDGSPANSAGQFRGWVYPRKCVTTPPAPGEDACIPVTDPTGGVGVRFRKLVLTVDDPSAPVLTLAGIPPKDGFTNQTSLSVAADASDAQSGIATRSQSNCATAPARRPRSSGPGSQTSRTRRPEQPARPHSRPRGR